MYFGLSFSKVGCDFRPLLIPIFTKRIANDFKSMVSEATSNFEKNIEKFTLINKNHPNVPWKAKIEDPLQPPDSLLEFYPLAEYLNNILTAYNKLRLCSPISLIDDVTNILQESLLSISKSILDLYSQEQQALTSGAKDAFTRLCMAFADDLIPHSQRCLHIIYPPTNTASYLGINLQILQIEGISFLNKEFIIAPIKHLLPSKVELIIDMDSKNDKENSEKEENEIISNDGKIVTADTSLESFNNSINKENIVENYDIIQHDEENLQ
ncbi:hypothetical protein HHI36_009450 [Cryptolaemus montrouzieri]|uniref:Conserved oligomeric Golgi complex subunit 8 n=1 Tax=Cryptolaemus montrouzieri TaxID=559131 RepID=A0ABD2MFM6_9CUCU